MTPASLLTTFFFFVITSWDFEVVMPFLNENHNKWSDGPLVVISILAITEEKKFSVLFEKNSLRVFDGSK